MDRNAERIRKQREERFKNAVELFQDVATDGRISRAMILRGWHLYLDVYKTSNERFGLKGLEDLAPNIIRCLQGYPFNESLVKRGHLFFQADTYKFGLKRCPGEVLEGLDRQRMFRALDFCEAMDSVGWKYGDLNEKFPHRD